MTTALQSRVAGRWLGQQLALMRASAANGRAVAATHAEAIDFEEAVKLACRVGVPALLAKQPPAPGPVT